MCSVPHATFLLTLPVLAGGRPYGSSNFGRARHGSPTWRAIDIYRPRHLSEATAPSFQAPDLRTLALPTGWSGISRLFADLSPERKTPLEAAGS
jgi:hypothetical protein